MTRWIAMEGASLLAREQAGRLREHIPPDMLAVVRDMEISDVARECGIADAEGAVWYSLSGIGLFDALWEFACLSGVGLEVDLKKIPVRQEIIEVCEVFGYNPYLLPSGGALLLGTDHGSRLVRCFEQEGIPGVVIGYAAEGKSRVVRRGEERRFLGPARKENEPDMEWKRR